MTTVLFAVAAADWVSGTCVVATMWHRYRWRWGRSLAARRHGFATPLADEVEEWLRHQG
jgi:hypothetical protein